MSTVSTTLTEKCINTGYKNQAKSTKRIKNEIFHTKEIVLLHAVDVHEKSKARHKGVHIKDLFKTLNDSLYRSLKNHFKVKF